MARHTVLVISVVFFLCSNFACGAPQNTVTLDMMKNWPIVISSDAIESEKYAAEEFNYFFKLATGNELLVSQEIPEGKGYIFIGQTATVKADDLGKEGLRVVISPNSLIITGGRPRGVLYGVYEFFEKYLDVQFLTTDHTYVPENVRKVEIPCETYSYVPPFEFRWAYFAENNTDRKFATRMRVNPRFATVMSTKTVSDDLKFGGHCGWDLINHSFHLHLPLNDYGKEHPEYFMFWKGKRAVDYKDTWGLGPNPCYASEGALNIITQSVRKYFDGNPSRYNVSLSCVDSHAHCQCEQCLKVNEMHGGTSGSHFEFINKVARSVKDDYPGKFVGSLAYFHTRHAPTNMRMEDNVQIQLCSIECCTHHALNDPDCPLNVPFYNDVKDWSKICGNIMIWNYNVNFHCYDLPFPNLKSIGPNVRFFMDNNVKGVFMQSAGNSRNSSMSDLKNWVISQCLWKPGRNSWDMALKFCKMHYGESAEPIIEWLSLLHNHVALSDVHYNCFPSPKKMNLDAEMGIQALNLFKKAMEMAQNDKIRNRVEKASICAYRLIIEASAARITKEKSILSLPDGYENALREYKRLTEKYNTDRSAERMEMADYFKRFVNLQE